VDFCLATSQNVCSTDRERFISCNPQYHRCIVIAVRLENPSAMVLPPLAIPLTPFHLFLFLVHYIFNQKHLLSYCVYPIRRMRRWKS